MLLVTQLVARWRQHVAAASPHRRMSGRQLRGPPAAGACWLLLCALGAVYRASEGFCPDPQATNYHPDALQEHAQDCEYSCLELAFFFKANAALDPTSVPECTYVTVDQVEACVETATDPSVLADREACGLVALGTASSATDCGAVRLADDPNTAACTHSVPDPAPQAVVSGEDRVIIGTPTVNLMARRLEVTGPRANAALRYIRIRAMADAGSGGGAIAVQSGGVTVFDCIFEDNAAGTEGGAIVGRDSSVAVERTIFLRNAAARGGAVALLDSTLRTDEATFQLNTATEHGGAVYAAQGSVSTDVLVSISYTEFQDNAADAACLRIGSAGTNAGDDCTADASCSYADQGTTVATCVATHAAACAALGGAGTQAGDDCTADARCTYNTQGTCTGDATPIAASCGAGDDGDGVACAVNADGDACEVATGACTYVAGYTPTCDVDAATDSSAECPAGCDVAEGVCEPATAPGTCTDEASNGEAACTSAGDCTFDDGTADDICEAVSPSFTGDAVYLEGVSRWSVVNTTYSPYDSLRTLETQGVPMVSCDDSAHMSCQLGQACSYGVSTLYCSPCQPNLASDDGFQCELCPPGRGPSVKQDACVQCEAGLYSSHGICIQCGRGKQPNPEQSACDNCLNGTYSDTGIRCEMCPAGTEPHSLIGSDEDAGWEDWAETDPHSLIGAADCILCHGGTYKPEGTLDSCMSTLVATVTTSDTTHCVLTASTDYGATPGACDEIAICEETAVISVEEDRVACGEVTGVDLDDSTACEAIATADDADTKACTYTPAGAIARCAYVAGTYSDGGTGDNVMDTVVSADTCTSTLVATVTTRDTNLCTLTASPDYGATPGACEDVGVTATCEYIPVEYEEDCTECDGGYQPTTNHSLCEECPAGKAGVNGTCETCPDGYRPNALPQSCTVGNTILNSPVDCVGMTGDICEYTCDHGYSVGGTHRCGLQAFEGGFCHPNDCIEGYEIDNSETVCAGFLDDECTYECDEGYSVTGHHVCGKNRAFTGGSCTPNPCTNGTSIAHSPTTCESRTGDDCNFLCDRGYFATGTHTCGTDGVLRGGACMPSSCSSGLTVVNSPTTCTGTTGYNCEYSCNPGYAVGQPHICGPDNWFRGGTCIPTRCITGVSLPNSPTLCNGTTGDVCEYVCEPGYTAQGVHTCTTAQFFAGGRCE